MAFVTLVGCMGSTEPVRATVTASFQVQQGSAIASDLLVNIAGVRVRLPAPSAGVHATGAATLAPRVGSLPVEVALVDASGDTLVAVPFIQEFKRDEHHWIDATVGRERPFFFCLTRVVAVALPKRTDSLFVFYGGLPSNADC